MNDSNPFYFAGPWPDTETLVPGLAYDIVRHGVRLIVYVDRGSELRIPGGDNMGASRLRRDRAIPGSAIAAVRFAD